MTDFEQIPDSTVTSDLISLGDSPRKSESEVTLTKNKPDTFTKSEAPKQPDTTCNCPAELLVSYLGHVIPEQVQDVLCWKDVFKSAVICFTILPMMVLYCYCNPIVVTAYLLLGLTTTTFTYRVYRYVVDSFQKSEISHPFEGFSDMQESTARDYTSEWINRALPVFVKLFNRIKHCVLVENVVDTVKFAVVLYLTAVIGGYISLRILLILTFAGAFSLPKVYTTYKTQIDDGLHKIHGAIGNGIMQAKQKFNDLRNKATKKNN